jgi:2,3-bisphosphoglycerate-independent phosphoglycerate mutase
LGLETDFDLIKKLALITPSKIIMLVIDGLGGLPHPESGKTELETAFTPNMDKLAEAGNCGFTQPVGEGITPGSAPGHLALCGYNPLKYGIGRGVLEALGIDFELEPGDIVARGNFCTINKDGFITDRRAGRISTEDNIRICRVLDGMDIEGIKVIVRPVKEHRFIVVLRGKGLNPALSDTDPQLLGVEPKTAIALCPEAEFTTRIVNTFLSKVKIILASQYLANFLLLRGFSNRPSFPMMTETYKLNPGAIASYPMYRGLAKVVGMTVLPTGSSIEDELETLERYYADHDFFFIHVKGADGAGEDGDFTRKVSVIEEVDVAITRLIKLKPEVLLIVGDHSTPAILKGHSWHDVPCLLYSENCRPDGIAKFGESSCSKGSLGRLAATSLMPLAMAHALKFIKFGA